MVTVSDIVRIRLYYDFASTLCYVAHRVLSVIEGEITDLGVELEWRPIDLTMHAPWNRGDSFRDNIRTSVQRTGRTLGVEVEMPDPWLDSRPASEVALRAPTPGIEARWRRDVFDSFFQQRFFALTPDLLELAQELVSFTPPSDGEDAFKLVEESSREAQALGVTGVPTLLLDNWMFGGIYDDESMVAVLRQLSEQYREVGSQEVN